jgi:4-coumarate--CoA ligase
VVIDRRQEAYYDEEEYFFIVGRSKDLIKYKGIQVIYLILLFSKLLTCKVSPEELEEILLKNPKIKDVAVVGLPDEEAGQLPLAFVVKNSDVNLSEEQVQDFLAGVDPMS